MKTIALIIMAVLFTGPASAASVILPIKVSIVRCTTCAEATAQCAAGLCCAIAERKCAAL